MSTAPNLVQRAFWTLIGLPICLLVLIATKIHFETLARLTSCLERSNGLRRIIAPRAVGICCIFLLGLGANAMILEGSASAWSIAAASLAWMVCLIGLDVALSHATELPKCFAQAIELSERSFVGFTRPCLRDPMQIAIVRHMAGLMVITAVMVVIAIVAAHVANTLLLIPAAVIWLRCNPLWQEIVHIESHTRFLVPKRQCARSAGGLTLHIMNLWSHFGLSQYFGMFPGWYKVEHIGVHHPAINSPHDVESVALHDRSSFLEFCRLTGRIAANTTTGFGMYGYLRRTRKGKFVRMTILGALVHVLTVAAAFYLSVPLGMWLTLATLGFAFSVGMIALSDHGLTDPDDPTEVYRNSYNVAWAEDDFAQYGNRIHLSHHLHPVPCWGPKAMAAAQEDEAQRFAEHGTILFYPFAYPDDLLRAYWRDDPDFLYEYVLRVGSARPTRDEWRRTFAARIRPAQVPPVGAFSRFISRCAAGFAGSHIPPPVAVHEAYSRS